MSHHILDAKQLLCPMPVIRLQNKVNLSNHHDTIEIICTDPGVLNDIPAWCRINQHQVLETKKINEVIHITVQVNADH